jgi:mxaJ protein
MRLRGTALWVSLLVGSSLPVIAQPPPAKPVLRVCADPDDLPFSSQNQEGFENKIATMVAKDLGDSLSYTWWPNRRGFVRSTLSARVCDLMVSAPKGYDLVVETNPYYRSTYYIVTRKDRHLNIKSLDDAALKSLRVGVNMIGYDYTNTPPAHALSARGIVSNVQGFSTFYGSDARPSDIVDAVANGKIDVAFVWGPIAGYYAKRSTVPLELVALPDTDRVTGFPFAYDISIGVRRGEPALRDQLNQFIDRHRAEIDSVFRDYGIPTAPLSSPSATAAAPH